MEPSKNAFWGTKMIYFSKWAKDLKMGTNYRFHITCKHKGAKNTGNHMEPSKKCVFVRKMIYFTKTCSKSENGNQLGSL